MLSWLKRNKSKVEGMCNADVALVLMHPMQVRSDGEVHVDILIIIGHILVIGESLWLSRGIR